MKQKPLNKIMQDSTDFDFWAVKKAIDAEVARLGWSKDKCIEFIKFHYGCRTRLVMTDIQLTKFLATLKSLPTPGDKNKPTNLRAKRRKDRRK